MAFQFLLRQTTVSRKQLAVYWCERLFLFTLLAFVLFFFCSTGYFLFLDRMPTWAYQCVKYISVSGYKPKLSPLTYTNFSCRFYLYLSCFLLYTLCRIILSCCCFIVGIFLKSRIEHIKGQTLMFLEKIDERRDDKLYKWGLPLKYLNQRSIIKLIPFHVPGNYRFCCSLAHVTLFLDWLVITALYIEYVIISTFLFCRNVVMQPQNDNRSI